MGHHDAERRLIQSYTYTSDRCCFKSGCFMYSNSSNLNSKTLPVLTYFRRSLIFPIHLFHSLVYPAGFFLPYLPRLSWRFYLVIKQHRTLTPMRGKYMWYQLSIEMNRIYLMVQKSRSHPYSQRNLFEILLNQPKIRLFLSFSN